jgi:hypothetical protein
MVSFSSEQRGPSTAKAVVERDYLKLPLAWTPTRRFDHHQIYEYQLTLRGGEVAVLRLVADKGWALTITHAAGQPETDRGLFGTPHDALMVLVAEFGSRADS